MNNNNWDRNREKNRRTENERTKRNYRLRETGGGGPGKGPYRDTCPANQKLLRLLARVPIGRMGNVIQFTKTSNRRQDYAL